jgi:hypothetical protein
LCGEGEPPQQYVDDDEDWPFHLADVSAAADPEDVARDWMRADMRRPVDLRGEPMFTAAVFKVAPGRFLWYLRAHHLVVDGFSGWVIASRTAGIYTALVAGASPEAKSLAVLADADARYRASASFGRDRDFWLGTLSGFEGAVSLSGRPSRSAAQAAVRSAHDLEADEVTGLRVAAQRLGTRISGLAVAAAALYVHRCTGQEDVVLGLSVLGRGARERRIPGMTANVVPVRLRVSRGMGAGELAGQVSERVTGALRHHRYRGEDIARDLLLERGSALFTLIVNVMPFGYQMALGGCRMAPYWSFGWAVSDARITVSGGVTEAGAQLAVDVNPDLYDNGGGTGDGTWGCGGYWAGWLRPRRPPRCARCRWCRRPGGRRCRGGVMAGRRWRLHRCRSCSRPWRGSGPMRWRWCAGM